jgi:RND family efflux transporter MFP subunit
VAEAEAAVQRARAARDTATAQRDDAVLRFERMDVRSPAAGIAMVRLVEPGAKVVRNADNPRSAQVLRLYDPAKLQVRVDVPLVDAAKVGVGQRAEVIVDVLPDRTFDGVVTRVVHEADVQKNTLQVKVAIEDPSPEIKPEMLARARFLAQPDPAQAADEQEAERLFVPAAAVQQSEGPPFVWLADQTDGTARRTPVSVGGATPDGWTAIIDGLRPGDRVIVEAPPALADGDRIQPVEE